MLCGCHQSPHVVSIFVRDIIFHIIYHCLLNYDFAEVATEGVLWEWVFLEISQNSQEGSCAGVPSISVFQGDFASIGKMFISFFQLRRFWAFPDIC